MTLGGTFITYGIMGWYCVRQESYTVYAKAEIVRLTARNGVRHESRPPWVCLSYPRGRYEPWSV